MDFHQVKASSINYLKDAATSMLALWYFKVLLRTKITSQNIWFFKKCLMDNLTPVSYTHLDVYKRQFFSRLRGERELSNCD